MRTLTPHPREDCGVETVTCQLDQSIGISTLARSLVIAPGTTRQRIERGANSSPPDGIEESLDEHRATLASAHLQRACVDIPELFCLKRLEVMCMAGVRTVRPEAAQAVRDRLGQ